MKSLLFTGLVAATTISSNVSAGFEVCDVYTMSRTGLANGHAIRFNFDGSRTCDQAATGADYFCLAGLNAFSVMGGGSVNTFCV